MASSTIVPPAVVPPLAARLMPPVQVRRPVARPRLIQRLRSAPPGGVVVVHAPAGYGKSTLLAQLADDDGRRLVWLRLDERSDDAVTFAAHLTFALGNRGVLDTDLLDRLSAGRAGVVPLALPQLLRHLGGSAEPLLIVLDDVHALTDPEALDLLREIIDHLGPQSNLVLAGRARPDIALARLRAQGRLLELGAADLRMTAGEGTALLRDAGADLDDEEGTLAVRRTEGWAAALYLTAIVLRDGDRVDGEEPGPRHADLEDYFRDEVLAGADAEDAEFLVQTAVLDELDPVVCDAVLQRSDSAERLRALAGADLFVAPLGRRSGVYQVHGLFRENLLAELRRSFPGLETELHVRASRWFAEAGDPERAIRHALDGGAPTQAADLVFSRLFEYETSGRGVVLERWCSWFTDEQHHAFPQLALTLGWTALDGGDGAAAAHWSAVARGAAPDTVLPDGTTVGAQALLLEAAVGAGGVAQVLRSAAAADARFESESPYRSVSTLLLGAAQLVAGEPEVARVHLLDAERRAAASGQSPYTIVLAFLALLAVDEGREDDAHVLMARARAFRQAAGVGDYATQAVVAATKALLKARSGDAAGAREDAARTARALTMSSTSTPWLATQARLVLARVAVTLGELASARVLLGEARAAAERDPDAVWQHRAIAEIATQVESAASAGGVEDPLTIAELRTLQYLPTHLSLREIGERLHVSRNTVKTHTISIYRKLGVNSRSEAVAAGRELGLLEA